MRKLTLILSLIFTVTLSSTSFGEWRKVIKSKKGNTYYVDFERIQKVDGYVYFWELHDFLKPLSNGSLSGSVYKQGDCKLFRFKTLSFVFYKEPMGRVIGDTPPVPKEHQFWKYPPPNNTNELTLKLVCALKK